jgi:hypothetical protein
MFYFYLIQVLYKQDCQECLTPCNPFRTDRLRCPLCNAYDCNCNMSRHRRNDADNRIPHRADLCHKCQAGLPCFTDRGSHCQCWTKQEYVHSKASIDQVTESRENGGNCDCRWINMLCVKPVQSDHNLWYEFRVVLDDVWSWERLMDKWPLSF